MPDLKKTAKQLAAHGRYGDTMLLHVNRAEVAGLASLIGGKLPHNPKTGLPEAFFFLPFLASLFGTAAPAAAAAGTLAAGAGAAAAPLAAAAAAPLAALPTMGTVAAGMHGISSLAAPALTAAKAALPAVTAAAPAALPAVTSAIPTASPLATAATTAAASPLLPATTSAIPTAASRGIGGFLKGMTMEKAMPYALIGSQILPSLGGLFQKKDKEEKGPDTKSMHYEGGEPVFPGDDYRPGIDPEWDYYKNNGGIVSLARGGLVPGYADGGAVDPQMQPPQDLAFPQNGVPATPGIGDGIASVGMGEEIPESPFPKEQIGSEMANEPPSDNEKELIMQTVEAIKGQSPDPQPVIAAFVSTFGEPALQDLVQRVRASGPAAGGPPQGPGDGMSDSIPAMIDGQQPAKLSEGEFVVPADAVSGLGNGSTDAGAQQLQGMVDNVRTMRGGGPVQPPAINPQQVMPYAGGGIVSLYKKGGGVRKPVQGPVDPLYDLEQYGPGVLPDALDRFIPSVSGFATTGDWMATGPEIRRGIAMKERAMAARRRQ